MKSSSISEMVKKSMTEPHDKMKRPVPKMNKKLQEFRAFTATMKAYEAEKGSMAKGKRHQQRDELRTKRERLVREAILDIYMH